jgi:hypothetical protein
VRLFFPLYFFPFALHHPFARNLFLFFSSDFSVHVL